MDRGQEVSRILDYHMFILKQIAILEEKKFKLCLHCRITQSRGASLIMRPLHREKL